MQAGLILAAAVTPDNTPAGYILTFAAPMGLFIVVGAILYLLFSRPHARIPAAAVAAPAHAAAAGPARAADAPDSIVSGQDGGPGDAERPDADNSAEGTEASG